MRNALAADASVYTRQALYTISQMKRANRCRVGVYTTIVCDITPTVSTSWPIDDSCKPRLSHRLLNVEKHTYRATFCNVLVVHGIPLVTIGYREIFVDGVDECSVCRYQVDP